MNRISHIPRLQLVLVCFENRLRDKQPYTRGVFASMLLALSLIFPMLLQAQQVEPAKKTESPMDLKREIEELKAGQQAIQKDLQELKRLLMERQPAPAETPREVILDVAGAYFKGEKNARLTLIEFSDYQCPFCARHVQEVLPSIERDYILTGKIKYVFRDFPLESIHPHALRASEAAACAGEQGKYWEMHDRLFGNSATLSPGDLTTHAQLVGLNPETFRECLNSNKHKESIRKGMAEAARLGVNGTPTFLIGLTSPNDTKVKVLRALKGSPPYANFKELLDGMLASKP